MHIPRAIVSDAVTLSCLPHLPPPNNPLLRSQLRLWEWDRRGLGPQRSVLFFLAFPSLPIVLPHCLTAPYGQTQLAQLLTLETATNAALSTLFDQLLTIFFACSCHLCISSMVLSVGGASGGLEQTDGLMAEFKAHGSCCMLDGGWRAPWGRRTES